MQKQNRAKSFSYIKGSLNRKNRLIKKQLYVVFQWTKPHAGVLHAVVPWNYSFSRLCGCTTECFCPSEPLPIAVFFILHIVAFCILIMDLPPLTKSFNYIRGSLTRKNLLIKNSFMSCFSGQNRTLACYTLLCLGTILSAAYAAAQQSVFVHLNLSPSLFFLSYISLHFAS